MSSPPPDASDLGAPQCGNQCAKRKIGTEGKLGLATRSARRDEADGNQAAGDECQHERLDCLSIAEPAEKEATERRQAHVSEADASWYSDEQQQEDEKRCHADQRGARQRSPVASARRCHDEQWNA